jgi:hypothetical protein
MSFLKKLFGGSSGGADSAPAGKTLREIEHQGFTIRATPYKEQGQWQTCGVVSREVDGALKEHRFIRADRFADEELAADHAIIKGKQLVEQAGLRMFEPG